MNRVYNSWKQGGSQSDAEDMVQMVFLKVWEKKISFRDTDHETAWILTATKNQCKDVLKSYERKHCGTLEEMPEPSIVKTVRTGNDLFIFGNFWRETYYRNGNTLMSDSGSEMPARLHFVSYGNGSYIFKDKEVAGDGSYYGTSIREFCEGYQVDPQKLMDTAEAHEKIRIKMLRDYVKQNHLDIQYYKDYGWNPVALGK